MTQNTTTIITSTTPIRLRPARARVSEVPSGGAKAVRQSQDNVVASGDSGSGSSSSGGSDSDDEGEAKKN